MLLFVIAIATFAFEPRADAQASQPCIPQPVPPAIDSAGSPPIGSDVIEFAATPSLQYPSRAWVVRLWRRGQSEAVIEIVRLRQQHDCNRYDIEARWKAPLRQEEYRTIAAKVAPVGVPPSAIFVPSSTGPLPDVVMDGTSINLRLHSQDWQVTRSLNLYGQGGAAISAIFHDLASTYVPSSELPAKDWRSASP